jgi:hypothetical protein
MWFAYLYRRSAEATVWLPDPDEVAAATTEAECVTGILEPPWDVSFELGIDPLPDQIPDIRPQVPAPVPRLFARLDTADWTGQTYEYVGVVEDADAPLPQPPHPLPRLPLEEHSVQAVHLLPAVGSAGQLLALDASQELSWLSPGTIALEDGSVTTAKLAPDAVTADKIADGAITGAELAPATITADKLAPGVLPAPPGSASDTTPGLIQLATTAEVQAGTDTTKALTPGRLVSRTATETRTGLVELASTAEAVAGTDTTRAVTPAGLAASIAALPAMPQASEATAGILRLATQADVTTGTDDTKAITPLKLAARLVHASETQRGLLELATQAEVTAGATDLAAVTPLKLQQKLTTVLPVQATETVAGILEVASFNDVNTGIDHSTAVTPQGLAQRLAALPLASTGNAGMVELATTTETTTGTDATRAVTPAGLAAKVPAGTPLSVVRYASGGTSLEASALTSDPTTGNLGLRTATPAAALHLVSETGAQSDVMQQHHRDAAGGTVLSSRRARGSLALPARLQANDILGVARSDGWLRNAADSADDWVNLGQERFAVESVDAQGRGGGRWNLLLSPGASATPAPVLSVLETGNVGITSFLGSGGFGTGATRTLALGPGVAPSTSPADTVQLTAVDRGGTALKRSLLVRTEDGTSHLLGDLSGIGTTLEATLGSGASYQALNVKGAVLYTGQSSVQERPMAGVTPSWVVSTDATRTARLTLSAYDATAAREGLRLEADGAARLGFFGQPAVVRQTVPAAATDATTTQALANAVRTALLNLGLCV